MLFSIILLPNCKIIFLRKLGVLFNNTDKCWKTVILPEWNTYNETNLYKDIYSTFVGIK